MSAMRHGALPSSEHLPFILSLDVVFLREVNEVNHGFGCQKQVFVQHFDLRQRQRQGKILRAQTFRSQKVFEDSTDRDE